MEQPGYQQPSRPERDEVCEYVGLDWEKQGWELVEKGLEYEEQQGLLREKPSQVIREISF